jgi:hypothetical protein
MSDIPTIPGDPRNREELKDWLERREKLNPGEALTAREYLMVERLRGKRPPYSIT